MKHDRSSASFPHGCGTERLASALSASGDVFVIAAIGPEAQADKRGFGRAVAAAQGRLDLIEEDETEDLCLEFHIDVTPTDVRMSA
jgi:hypothetical protein